MIFCRSLSPKVIWILAMVTLEKSDSNRSRCAFWTSRFRRREEVTFGGSDLQNLGNWLAMIKHWKRPIEHVPQRRSVVDP